MSSLYQTVENIKPMTCIVYRTVTILVKNKNCFTYVELMGLYWILQRVHSKD